MLLFLSDADTDDDLSDADTDDDDSDNRDTFFSTYIYASDFKTGICLLMYEVTGFIYVREEEEGGSRRTRYFDPFPNRWGRPTY
jgi:hypothetical protein